jgi:hypothetical protein
MILIRLSTGKCYLPAGSGSSLFHLTSCTPTKSNWSFCFHISFTSVMSEPALYRLIRARANLMSIFLSIGRLSKQSVQGVVGPMPNTQAGGPPIVNCPRLLIPYICSYLLYLEAVSFICNLRTRNAVVISGQLNIGAKCQHSLKTGYSPWLS